MTIRTMKMAIYLIMVNIMLLLSGCFTASTQEGYDEKAKQFEDIPYYNPMKAEKKLAVNAAIELRDQYEKYTPEWVTENKAVYALMLEYEALPEKNPEKELAEKELKEMKLAIDNEKSTVTNVATAIGIFLPTASTLIFGIYSVFQKVKRIRENIIAKDYETAFKSTAGEIERNRTKLGPDFFVDMREAHRNAGVRGVVKKLLTDVKKSPVNTEKVIANGV